MGDATTNRLDAADTAGTLASELQSRGALSIAEAVQIGRQVLAEIGKLHEQDVLHRDVRLATVKFDGGRWTLRAAGRAEGETNANRHKASACGPPEGVVDRSGDLFCVGRILFELIAGAPAGRGLEIPSGIGVEQRIALRALLPVIDRACAPSPHERFQLASDMMSALDRAVSSLSAAERGDNRSNAGHVHTDRSTGLASVGQWRRLAIAAVLLAAGATVALLQCGR